MKTKNWTTVQILPTTQARHWSFDRNVLKTCRLQLVLRVVASGFCQQSRDSGTTQREGEHRALVDSEKNPERKAFLELAWHAGAAQIDLVSLTAENIDWNTKTITYFRCKTGKVCVLRFGEEVAAILRRLPASGSLFPNYSKLCSADRATRFAERVEKLGIKTRSEESGIPSISLHSYRYAWAERARAAGYPERFVQETLGHASAAIHCAYAKSVRVELPSLEEYEKRPELKLIAA